MRTAKTDDPTYIALSYLSPGSVVNGEEPECKTLAEEHVLNDHP